MRILIAEDDTSSRLVLEAILRKAGHDVVAAEDGLSAWQASREEPFPVLVSDWRMPQMDGLALSRAIRQVGGSNYTYIILLTAHGGKANYLEAMNAGVDDFLAKPVDEEALLARLHVAERILGLRRHVKRLEGILSVCGYCKKIRDASEWRQMECYMSDHSEATFSHGICPDCLARVTEEVRLA